MANTRYDEISSEPFQFDAINIGDLEYRIKLFLYHNIRVMSSTHGKPINLVSTIGFVGMFSTQHHLIGSFADLADFLANGDDCDS